VWAGRQAAVSLPRVGGTEEQKWLQPHLSGAWGYSFCCWWLLAFCPALQGGFKPEQHVIVQSETNWPTSVHAADLDGDGDLDVLSVSSGWWTGSGHTDSKIAWYANDGKGQFGPQQVISTEADGASCVYTADLDGDGDLDILPASANGTEIPWYANDGTGRFGPQRVITTKAAVRTSVSAADLDGDGDVDVLSALRDPYAKISWYANDGTGHFGPRQGISEAVIYDSYVTAADLDGDGDVDVLSTSGGDGKIAWYANDGTGRFGPQQVITTEASIADCVYAADLDGDGDLDVLWAYSRDDKIAWYANDGKGQFGPQQVITTEVEGAECVYAADLDGDGDLDVLSASWNDDKIAWYANDGKGQFGPQQVITAPAASGASCVYAADLDADGDLDVLSASSGDNKIAWYANDGKAHFGPQQVITTAAGRAESVYAADLDGDGDLDVLSASSRDGKIAWYANDGKGQFGLQQVITTEADGAEHVYAADLDGDGDLDVLSASRWGGKIAWYANDGKGHFGPQQVVTAAAICAQSACYAADLDGDGDLDVLSALSVYEGCDEGPTFLVDAKIAWYANDGTGQFGPQQVITTAAPEDRRVYAADLDGDGDQDVLSAPSSFAGDDRIAWYANDGTGQFGPQQVISTWDRGPKCVYAADLDADGDLDVLSASYGDYPSYSHKIAWYANDRMGQFGPQQVITTKADGPTCVYAADLDGDGDLDVLSASYWDDKIAWYENE